MIPKSKESRNENSLCVLRALCVRHSSHFSSREGREERKGEFAFNPFYRGQADSRVGGREGPAPDWGEERLEDNFAISHFQEHAGRNSRFPEDLRRS
jgi:hypothetical protein